MIRCVRWAQFCTQLPIPVAYLKDVPMPRPKAVSHNRPAALDVAVLSPYLIGIHGGF